jgi:hypothetical protein
VLPAHRSAPQGSTTKYGKLIIGYNCKGGKFVGREANDPRLLEALENYLQKQS